MFSFEVQFENVCALKALSNNTIAVKTGCRNLKWVIHFKTNGEFLGRTSEFTDESRHCGLTEVLYGGNKCLVIVYNLG